jgi:hypothetical protein
VQAARRLRRSGLDLTGPLNGKQAAAIMDQVLKAVRSHIEGRDIERVFVSCRGLGPLGLKDSPESTAFFDTQYLAVLVAAQHQRLDWQ